LREGGDFDKFFAYIFMGPLLLIFICGAFSIVFGTLKFFCSRVMSSDDSLSEKEIELMDDHTASDIRLG